MKAKSELGGNIESPAETTGPAVVLDIYGEQISPIWAAEFRGFFWGEGTLNVQCAQPLQASNPQWSFRGYSIAITASIGLRDDDSAVLEAFVGKLGGKLRSEPYRTHVDRFITRWVCGTAVNNLVIAKLLVSPTGLPFQKAKQLAVWTKAVETKLAAGAKPGSRYTQEQREYLLWADQELKRMRIYGR